MARTRVSGPVAKRFHDRLQYWHLNGPYLDAVRDIHVGILPKEVPAALLGHPVTLYVSAYPVAASGAAAAGAATSTTEYTGVGEIAACGHNMNDEDGYFQFADTLDDIVKIVCEIEQQTAWKRFTVPTLEGDNVLIQASGAMTVEWPSLKDESGAFYHFAIVRWDWKAYVTWE